MEEPHVGIGPISVIVADDQVLFAQGLRRIIEISASDIKVISIATGGRELIEHVEKLQPDVILMDVRMPGMDGVEATRIIHKRYPAVRIIMLTTFDDDEYVQHAVEYGAVGYLLKDIPPEELFEAIRSVRSHSFIVSPAVARKLSSRGTHSENSSGTGRSDDEPVAAALHELTDRERQVLELILAEFDNRLIADRLHLTEHTVRNYVSSIYSKLTVKNRFELIRSLRSSQ